MYTSQNDISQDTHNLLKLMSFVIFSDGHLYATEITALLKAVSAVPLTDIHEYPLDEGFIRDWFLRHEKDISKEALSSKNDIDTILLVVGLSDIPYKKRVLDVLIHTCCADGYIPEDKGTLISIVQAYWG